MKKIKYLLITLVTFFCLSVSVNAASFKPTINMSNEINDNMISIVLGFTNEEVIALTQEITYDSTKLTLVDVTALENFTVTKSIENIDGDLTTIKILADSEYSLHDTNYAVLTFSLTNKYKVKSSTRIRLSNYEAAGSDKIKMRNPGYVMRVDRTDAKNVLFIMEDITKLTDIKIWFEDHLVIILISCAAFIVLLFIIVHIPSKKTYESRDKKISSQIRGENFDNSNYIKPVTINRAALYEPPKLKEKHHEPSPEMLNPFNMSAPQNNMVNKPAPIDMPKIKSDDPFVELGTEPTKEEGLIHFKPMFGEEEKDDEHQDKIEYFSWLLLLLLLGVCFISPVKATTYPINEMRECVVGNIDYSAEYDLNHDNKVDIVDIILTKDLTTISPETTTKNIVTNSNTTKNNSPKPISTIRTSNNFTVEKTSKYTTKFTNKSTTTKKVVAGTTKRTTTSRNTTTIKTTTKSTTIKPSYKATINVTNGTLNKTSGSASKGQNLTFTATPKTGYRYKNVTCSNNQKAEYAVDLKRLTVVNLSSNTTCTINFEEINDIKVTINVTNGTPATSTMNVKYNGSTTFNVSPKTGYVYDSFYCPSSVTSSFSNGVLKVSGVKTNTICTVKYKAKVYSLTLKYGTWSKTYDNITHGKTKKYTLLANNKINNLKCNNVTVPFTSNYDSIEEIYEYVFNYAATANTTCIFT